MFLATDSQKALKTVGRGAQQSEGQYIVRAIYGELDKIAARGVVPWLVWVPAHSGVKGNEAADRAAKGAFKPGQRPDRESQERRRLVKTVTQALIARVQEEEKKEKGKQRKRYGRYTWELDGAAPGKHTINLYNALDRAGSNLDLVLLKLLSPQVLPP